MDRLRTMTWARVSAIAAGVRDGKKFELLVADRLKIKKDEASGLLSSYLRGARKSFKKREPKPYSVWVERTDRLWPETSAWFYTPVWYLMEKQEFLPTQIKQCIELLPQRFQALLLTEPNEDIPAPMRLQGLWGDLIYELAEHPTPWAMGALACAVRRAELAGSGPIHIRACTGLIWVLDHLIERQDPWVQEPLLELREVLLAQMNETAYGFGGVIKFEYSNRSLAIFSSGMLKFQAKRESISREAYS